LKFYYPRPVASPLYQPRIANPFYPSIVASPNKNEQKEQIEPKDTEYITARLPKRYLNTDTSSSGQSSSDSTYAKSEDKSNASF
jgi:hypothetical protein